MDKDRIAGKQKKSKARSRKPSQATGDAKLESEGKADQGGGQDPDATAVSRPAEGVRKAPAWVC